jgi:uncharacterized protein (TIGR00251 family)
MPKWYHWQGDALIVEVTLQPRASNDEIAGVHADHLKIRITAPPVDGKANKCLCRFMARELSIAASSIRILHGETSRAKRLSIHLKNKVLPAVLVAHE